MDRKRSNDNPNFIIKKEIGKIKIIDCVRGKRMSMILDTIEHK